MMRGLAAVILALGLVGCDSAESLQKTLEARGVLVKVCADGTAIYRKPDGSHRTTAGSVVENPTTVCW